MGSLYPQCILLPVGCCEELSKAHRCTELGTSLEEEGTSCKDRGNSTERDTCIIGHNLSVDKVMILLDVVAIFVCLLAKGYRGVDPEKLVEKGTR